MYSRLLIGAQPIMSSRKALLRSSASGLQKEHSMLHSWTMTLCRGFVIAGGFGALGLVDDLLKIRGGTRGLRPRAKLCGQLVIASIAAAMIYCQQAAIPNQSPLRLDLAGASLRLGVWFIPLAIVVIVGASNAVNLADGLDGLAGGCLLFALAAMGVADYLAGCAGLAASLGLPHVAGAEEMAILAAAVIGTLLGFLWFNCHPAQVFMGDTGSLPLGALLGLLAVVARQEALLAVVGGVFVAEAASVILQVGYYKWRKRRIFRCAPLHHHFQFLGWPENRIVTRFWIASALCAFLGLGLVSLSGLPYPQAKTGNQMERDRVLLPLVSLFSANSQTDPSQGMTRE